MERAMNLYHKTLMWSLKMVTGDKEIKTWTFHKGCLRILGNDWVNRHPKWSFLRFLWTVIYPAAYVLLLVVSIILTVKYSIQMDKKGVIKFIRGMNGFIVSIAYVFAAVKALLFKFRGGELLALMDMVDGLGKLDGDGRPHRDRTLVNCTLYMGLLFVTPGAWTIYFTMFHDGQIPYPTDFPWDQETRVGYLATFATDFVTSVYCAALHSVYDTMFPMVVGGITGHVASLKVQLARIGNVDSAVEVDILRNCYYLHVNILRVIKLMNDCFRLLFLIQTMYTVLHACVIIYQVMQVSDILLGIMNTAPILSSAYFQLLMYCYYGQLLTNHFEELKTSLYENSWYASRLRVQKPLALMSLMADRPVRLDSYGITSAAHPTYLSSLQDSISYYLILKTLTNEE